MSEVPLARAAWTSSDESRTCLLCPALRDRGGWDTSERECLARQDLEPESASRHLGVGAIAWEEEPEGSNMPGLPEPGGQIWGCNLYIEALVAGFLTLIHASPTLLRHRLLPCPKYPPCSHGRWQDGSHLSNAHMRRLRLQETLTCSRQHSPSL